MNPFRITGGTAIKDMERPYTVRLLKNMALASITAKVLIFYLSRRKDSFKPYLITGLVYK
jgi:hypothetical protein